MKIALFTLLYKSVLEIIIFNVNLEYQLLKYLSEIHQRIHLAIYCAVGMSDSRLK